MDNKPAQDEFIAAAEKALCPDTMPALAMTYSPLQPWECVHDPVAGHARGTIFPGLDKPFLEGKCPSV
ncbi:spore coat associated protein CotJA [Oscillospiraceae bacterium PP1C4]